MGETKPWAIGIVILCTVFTSLGSFLMKTGVNRFSPSWQGIINAYPVIIGLFFYFIGFLMLTTAFRHGDLSVLFPFISLSFIWVGFLAYYFLKEVITIVEMAGFATIVCGVVLIGVSSRNGKIKVRG